MKLTLLLLSMITFISCKTTSTESSFTKSEMSQTYELPKETQDLWNNYVKTLEGKKIQKGCEPIVSKAKQAPKGIVVIYHGFTGCPDQFINVARELNDLGYHVLLPLLPGNGRIPKIDTALIEKLEKEQGKKIYEIVAAGKAPEIVKDDFSDIPLNVKEYYQYAETMTKIAASFSGERIIVGLSLGGGLSVATLIKGAELSTTESGNIWDRGLLYTPFFKAPSIQGNAAPIVGGSVPNFGFSFGASCEAGQLRTDYAKRLGICDFAIGNIKVLQELGEQVGKKSEMEKIKVPLQVLGISNDNTSDNTSIINAFKYSNQANTKVCFYPDEVGHATVFSGDFVPLNSNYESQLQSAREINLTPRISRFWARNVHDRSISFITNGFDNNQGPFVISSAKSTEKNKEAKLCELKVDIAQVMEDNIRLCSEGKGLDDYCKELDLIQDYTCNPDSISKLPSGSMLKAYCESK